MNNHNLGGFILGLIVAGVGTWLYMRQKQYSSTGDVVNPEQVKQKQENLEKILKLVREKGEIANDDVQRALGVSNATAERYLNELQNRGNLEQIGSTGQNVKYKPK